VGNAQSKDLRGGGWGKRCFGRVREPFFRWGWAFHRGNSKFSTRRVISNAAEARPFRQARGPRPVERSCHCDRLTVACFHNIRLQLVHAPALNFSREYTEAHYRIFWSDCGTFLNQALFELFPLIISKIPGILETCCFRSISVASSLQRHILSECPLQTKKPPVSPIPH
jgi:hypothetical protein